MDRHLLILDLDETLIYGIKESLEREADFKAGPYRVYRRPYVVEFLETVAGWYDLAVWSSASSAYVQLVVQATFPHPGDLRFVWSQQRCVRRFEHERCDFYWVKDLKKVKRMGFPLERILVLDDSPEKLERNYGNLLRVRPFFGAEDDDELRAVLPTLDRLRMTDNLRSVEKRGWRNRDQH